MNDYPLIKFEFTKIGVLNIYRPDNLSDIDFYDLIQFLNRIIFKNRKTFFDIQSFKEKKKQDEFFENNFEEENELFKFSIKDYFTKMFENNYFSFELFQISFLEIKIIGNINVYFFNNNTGIINFVLFGRILGNEIEIFSYDYITSSEEIKDIIINKLGEAMGAVG